MSVPERVPEIAGIIWTLQSPQIVWRTHNKDDCQQRSRRSSLITALARTPIRQQPRMIALLTLNCGQSPEDLRAHLKQSLRGLERVRRSDRETRREELSGRGAAQAGQGVGVTSKICTVSITHQQARPFVPVGDCDRSDTQSVSQPRSCAGLLF